MRLTRLWIGLCLCVLGCGSTTQPVLGDAGGSGGTDSVSSGDDTADSASADSSSAPDSSADGGSDVAVLPCNPGFQVDGQDGGWQNAAGCDEYAKAGSVNGMNGSYFAASPATAALQFLADWTWRTDGALCPAMFARARFSTGNGKQHWQLQVFADGHNATTQNGAAWTGKHQAAYGFAASAKQALAHPQFEFRLDAVPVGQVAMLLHAPDKASNLQGNPPGCGQPEQALVLEPTVLVAQMAVTGLSALAPAQGLIAVTVDKPVTKIGEVVTVWGAFFGTAAGTATINGTPVDVVAWQPGAVQIKVPILAAAQGEIVLTTADGKASNPLTVTLKSPPDPAQCQGKSPGTACDDGLSCTTNDTCKAGSCSGTDTCTGTGPCAPTACSAGSDCIAAPLAAGAPCKGAQCNGFCDAGGSCLVDASTPVCADGNACTQELCAASGCDHTALTGSTCDDGDFCTVSDACAAGKCAGAAKDCNDNSVCTLDKCDPTKGCVYPTACDDGNPCTIDSCQNGQCAVTNLADTTGCDDLDPCTTDTHCSGGKCLGTPVPGCK